ncbi:MAG: MFS transporter [Gemmatimonadaceae bacterium]
MPPWPPFTFVTLSAVGFLGRLSYEMARSPLTALYAKHLGAPTSVIGLIVAAVTVTGIVVKLPAGALADILGFKKIMVSGLLVKATGPWLYLIVRSWQQLLLVRFYHGFSTALYAPAASALVAKRYPKERAHRLGLYSAAENAGVVLGPVIGAAILAAYSFDVAFIVSGVIGTLALLLVIRIPRDVPAAVSGPRPTAGAVTQQLVQGVREIVSDKTIRLTSLIEGTLYMGVGALQAYLPLYALTVHISVGRMGLLFGGQGIASILSRPTMGTLSDRVGRRPIIVIGVLLCATMLAVMPHVAGFIPLLVLNVLFGLGTGMVTPSTTAMIGDRVKAGNFGSAMGVFGSLWDAGHAGGPIIAGFLIAAFGYQVSFLAIAIVIVAALAVFILGTRQSELA